MGLAHCSEADRKLIRECLVASVEGPFFPDWEFSLLFWLERAEVAAVLQAWPDVGERDPCVRLAVNNALNNLLGYPHGLELGPYVSASEGELRCVLERWRLPARTAR